MNARGDWIQGVIDPASLGSNQVDGRTLMEVYGRLGLRLNPAVNAVESGLTEVWNLLVTATGGARAFRELKGDGSGAMNSYHAVTLQFDSRERAQRLAERLRHAVKLCGGKTSAL